MANIGSLASVANQAQSLSNLILVTPQSVVGYQPQNAKTQDGKILALPSALVFHYEGEQNVLLKSDITDHYVEDNTAIQDQIAIKPVMITTGGFIGELNDIAPIVPGLAQGVRDKLSVISAFTPALSVTALVAYDQAVFAYNTLALAARSAVDAWSTIAGVNSDTVISAQGIDIGANQNKQQRFFQQFYGYQNNRTLFTVQTPWAIFQDMAIDSLKAIQSDETNVISEFQVTFKMMRFASTSQSGPSLTSLQGRAANQAAGVVDMGTYTPQASTVSFSDEIARTA